VIITDDLGFSDLGCYGGEIATPHLDELASKGLRCTQFYNTGRCWPTRAAVLTGFYPHQIRRDTLPGVKPSGGRGQRPDWAPLLPMRLKPLGYRSYHSGKWHLDGMPIATGFDRSYYLRDQGRFFNPKTHWEDDQKLPPIEPDSDYYATTAIADHAIDCLSEHAAKHRDQPFFHYLAFTAPHFPLHALPADIARNSQAYQQDWEFVRAARWQKQQATGLLSGTLSPVERTLGPPYDFPNAIVRLGPGEVNRPLPWKDLTKVQRDFQAAKMAIHAAMIDRVDREIGRVFAQLRVMDAFQNTLILFFSDNGASAEIMVRDDGHDPSAPAGSAKSYLCLGPGWSTTCNTPFRKHKTWVHEGGIATPLVIHWPEGIEARGELNHTVGHVIDLVPTILNIAGLDTLPVTPRDVTATENAPPFPGVNLLPAWQRKRPVDRKFIWWSHEGNRAIRIGDWKLVAAGEKSEWELYNLKTDRTETNDLSQQFPDRVAELAGAWKSRMLEFRATALRDLDTKE
jgi:arylsulfatase